MPDSDLAVSVRGLSKSYTIAQNAVHHTTAAEAIVQTLKKPRQKTETETFWALKDIDFDIHKGDVVGIIGRNGAGKSTLLKILSRIVEPTTGQIDIYGRIGSLLEVGTGFHPELTGRENIFLNGAILGMSKREIQKQFDAIIDFSGTEKFLDTPVKRYSSGMYVRLAFAVAAHLDPEILIVDEVLAVGDADFQKKCMGKMQDVAKHGRTILFVSHGMAAVRQLCSSALLLSGGRIIAQDTADKVVTDYLAQKANQKYQGVVNEHGMELCDVFFRNPQTERRTDALIFDRDYDLVVKLHAHQPITNGGVIVQIADEMGTRISSLCTPEEGIPSIDFDGLVEVTFAVPRLQLFPGKYTLNVVVRRFGDTTVYLDLEAVLVFEVMAASVRQSAYSYGHAHGIVRIADGASVHCGVAARI